MTVLKVLQEPDPILREKSKPVEKFDRNLRDFIQDLIDTMYEESGIGIAAIQVGKPLRVLIVDVPEDEERKPHVIINPVVKYLSPEKVILDEGCLSVKGIEGNAPTKGQVERPVSIAIEYQDISGKKQNLLVNGNQSKHHLWFARCLQHELDHLDGILFIDKLFMPMPVSNKISCPTAKS
jgi:formylmethionine deformylase/peptide deformylase